MTNSSLSFSASFSSYSSSSSSSGGQTRSTTHTTQSHTNPSGTTVRTSSSNNGAPSIEETKHYDASGRQLLEAPGGGNGLSHQRQIGEIEVEDVTDEVDADEAYREKMEDEYAKREGGA